MPDNALAWWMAVLAVTALAAACGTKVTVVGDDGATTGVGASPSSSSSSRGAAPPNTTNVVGSQVSSSITIDDCDTGVFGDLGDPLCDACMTCSQTAQCFTETQACLNNPDCVGYEQCRVDCTAACDVNQSGSIDPNEEPCYSGSCHGDLTLYFADPTYVPPPMSCLALYGEANKTGVDDYWSMLSCEVCQACPINCNAAQNCS